MSARASRRTSPATSCRSASTAAWCTASPAAPPPRSPSGRPTIGRSGSNSTSPRAGAGHRPARTPAGHRAVAQGSPAAPLSIGRPSCCSISARSGRSPCPSPTSTGPRPSTSRSSAQEALSLRRPVVLRLRRRAPAPRKGGRSGQHHVARLHLFPLRRHRARGRELEKRGLAFTVAAAPHRPDGRPRSVDGVFQRSGRPYARPHAGSAEGLHARPPRDKAAAAARRCCAASRQRIAVELGQRERAAPSA